TDHMCIKVLQCQFANLVGFDFSNLKLDFVDFSVANLAGAKFIRANLKQASFIRADLTGADFTGANLTSVNFTAAVLAGADFTNANLTSTVICGVDLESLIGITEKQLGQVQVFREKGSRYCP
ncbi:MAG: pentapeptide repeat-containing protein, partial [Actinomycetota bacterium]